MEPKAVQSSEKAAGFTYTRKSGLIATTFLAITSLTGAGIYSLLRPVAEIAGAAIIFSFLLDLGIALLIAGCYGECASLFPTNGGSLVYIREAFGNKGLYVGWLVWLSNMAYGSLCAYTAAMFVGNLLGINSAVLIVALSIGFVLLFTIFNLKGSNVLAAISNPITVALLCTLVIGAIYLFLNPTGSALTPIVPNGFTSIFIGSALLIDVFIGFEDIVSVAEEIKEPRKTIPKALRYSLLISAIFYFLVIFAVFSSMDINTITNSDLTFIEGVSSNPVIYFIVFIGAILTLLTSVGVAVMAASRNLYALARWDFIDRRWSEIHPKLQSPLKAILLTAFLTAIISISGQVETIASISNISYLISVAFISLSVIKFRKIRKYDKDAYKMKYHPLGAILTLAICIFLVFFIDVNSIFITLGFFLIGLATYLIFSSKKRIYGTIFMVVTFSLSLISIFVGILVLIAGIITYLFSIANPRGLYLSLSGISTIMALVFFIFLYIFVFFGHFIFTNATIESGNAFLIVVSIVIVVLCLISAVIDTSSLYRAFPFVKGDFRQKIKIVSGAQYKKKITGLSRLKVVLNSFLLENFVLIGISIFLFVYMSIFLADFIQIKDITIKGTVVEGNVFEFFYLTIIGILASILLSKGFLGLSLYWKNCRGRVVIPEKDEAIPTK
nr:APC family permease [Candidatus Sigynarchaeota archaeon]